MPASGDGASVLAIETLPAGAGLSSASALRDACCRDWRLRSHVLAASGRGFLRPLATMIDHGMYNGFRTRAFGGARATAARFYTFCC